MINERYFPSGIVLVPLDRKVKVSVDEGTIVVNREPLKVKAVDSGPAEVTVIFKLTTARLRCSRRRRCPRSAQMGTLKKSQAFGTTTCVFGNDGADKTELSCKFTPKGTNAVLLVYAAAADPYGRIASSPTRR